MDDIESEVVKLGITVLDAKDYETEDLNNFCSDELFDAIRNNLGHLHENLERREMMSGFATLIGKVNLTGRVVDIQGTSRSDTVIY